MNTWVTSSDQMLNLLKKALFAEPKNYKLVAAPLFELMMHQATDPPFLVSLSF
eukprot:bmy_04514T0